MAKVKIYGRLTLQDGTPLPAVKIAITYYEFKKPPVAIEIETDLAGDWEIYLQRALDPRSYYLFQFPGDVLRKVYVTLGAPGEIRFDQLVKGTASNPAPLPGVPVPSGGYDRYIGTLGLAVDAPVGAGFPNYLDFPAAKKYEWVGITTTQTLPSGIKVFVGEEWICNTDSTPAGIPANWSLRNPRDRELYEANRILEQKIALPPNEFVLLPFKSPEIIGNTPIAADRTRLDMSLWFPSFASGKMAAIDINLVADFESEPSGDRYIAVCTLEFDNPPLFGEKNPDGTLVRGNGGLSNTGSTFRSREEITDMNVVARAYTAAATQSQTTLIAGETGITMEYYSDLQTIFYVFAWQNSPKTIYIEKAHLSLRSRFPGGV